jgi:hypothetical protein
VVDEENEYRATIAAAVALEPVGCATAIIAGDESMPLADAIAKAESVSKSWLIEIPFVGAILEELAKRADVSVFHIDEVPGSLFATTEKLAGGKSTVLVAGGSIGTRAPSMPEVTEKSNKVARLLKTAEERYVLGVVLVPEQKDSQGDIYSHAEVRKAAHEYMENAGGLGRQHSELVNGKLRILETYVAPADFEVEGEKVTQGTWLLGIRAVDDDLWADIKKGSFTGFSIGGQAFRNPEQA